MSEYQYYEFQALDYSSRTTKCVSCANTPPARPSRPHASSEKTALLYRLATDHEHGLRAELLRRFHSTRLTAGSATAEKSRTVAALLDEVERRERHPAARAEKRDV